MEQLIDVNFGYIYNLLDNTLIGCIANNNDYCLYYTEDSNLNNIINVILNKKYIRDKYQKEQNTISCTNIRVNDKEFIHGFNYLLPYPFYVKALEFKRIKFDDLYEIYQVIKQNEGENIDQTNEEISK